MSLSQVVVDCANNQPASSSGPDSSVVAGDNQYNQKITINDCNRDDDADEVSIVVPSTSQMPSNFTLVPTSELFVDEKEIAISNGNSESQQNLQQSPPQMQQEQSSPPPTTSNLSRFIDLNDDVPTCRICHCTELNKLISPCHCSGSLKWVHHSCLQQWLSATNSQRCELCKYQFSMSVKYKPLHKWGALNATATDRRKLICNSVFNLISMMCVFWSIYVLVERASLDARIGQIDWSFWTKMCVITIGFIGGVIFLFVQLRFYFSIFIRWRQSNRIIVIRNANSSEIKLN